MRKLLIISILFLSIGNVYTQDKITSTLQRIIKTNNELYTYKPVTIYKPMFKIIYCSDSEMRAKLLKNTYVHVDSKVLNPDILTWDLEYPFLFSISASGKFFKFFQRSVDEIYQLDTFDYDTVEVNEAHRTGNISESLMPKMERDFEDSRLHELSPILLLHLYYFGGGYKFDKLHYDFTIQRKFNLDQKILYIAQLYILTDSLLRETSFMPSYLKPPINIMGRRAQEDLGKTKKKYKVNFSETFQVISLNKDVYFLSDSIVYARILSSKKFPKDTILPVGKIIKDKAQKETKVSSFYIHDKDNMELLLFPPYYFRKENEYAPAIRTLDKDDELYKLTGRMAKKYFKKKK